MQSHGLKKEETVTKKPHKLCHLLNNKQKERKREILDILTPLNIETSKVKKYCMFQKSGIKYVDYKDADFLMRFINEQGKILPRRSNRYFIKIPT